ncbi:hypothetical protein NCS52_01591500 [Fusarium sp. LHS14.1]|nr:hypothetical protein NCS52_01591500 [Fusarium sp. LHS14.1]
MALRRAETFLSLSAGETESDHDSLGSLEDFIDDRVIRDSQSDASLMVADRIPRTPSPKRREVDLEERYDQVVRQDRQKRERMSMREASEEPDVIGVKRRLFPPCARQENGVSPREWEDVLHLVPRVKEKLDEIEENVVYIRDVIDFIHKDVRQSVTGKADSISVVSERGEVLGSPIKMGDNLVHLVSSDEVSETGSNSQVDIEPDGEESSGDDDEPIWACKRRRVRREESPSLRVRKV